MTVIVLHKFFKFRLKVSESFTHQQAIVFDDTQLFGPLAQPLLPPQEGTNPSVLHQFNGRLRWWPLVLRWRRLFSGYFLLIVGLVWTAHCLPIIYETKIKDMML